MGDRGSTKSHKVSQSPRKDSYDDDLNHNEEPLINRKHSRKASKYRINGSLADEEHLEEFETLDNTSGVQVDS
jgi:hypothetical protein